MSVARLVLSTIIVVQCIAGVFGIQLLPTNSVDTLTLSNDLNMPGHTLNMSIPILQDREPWPADDHWPFQQVVPANHLTGHNHPAIRFTYSRPHPPPIIDLSRIGYCALVSFGRHVHLQQSPVSFTFPEGPYGPRRVGPFVSLRLTFPPGDDIQRVLGEIQPIWEVATRSRPIRSMDMTAAVEINGQWTDVANLAIRLDPQQPERAPSRIRSLPISGRFQMDDRTSGEVLCYNYPGHQEIKYGSSYARYQVIERLIVEVEIVSRKPQDAIVEPWYTHFGTGALHWVMEIRHLRGTTFRNGHLLRALRTLSRIVIQYGVFETSILVRLGGQDVATMRIYE